MQNEIFSLTLNEEGSDQLFRFFKKARIVFILCLVISLVSLMNVWIRLTMMRGAFTNNSLISRQLVVSLGFTMVSVILIPLQAYYYLAFAKKIRQSMQEQNAQRFNRSFRLLNTNAVFALVSLSLNVLYIGYIFSSTWLALTNFS